jgi:POT family proton-dependent oligopeptide transporter
LLLAAASLMQVTPLLLVLLFFVILDLCYAWNDPAIASIVSRDSPAPANAMMMAAFKASWGVGYIFCGFIGGFYERLGPAPFWLLHAGLFFATFLFILLTRPIVTRLIDPARGLPRLVPEAAA